MHRFIDGGERMQAGDQQRSAFSAIVDDLKAALLGVERLRAPIIDNSRSIELSAQRVSIATFCPST
jgi:hypothetical protein